MSSVKILFASGSDAVVAQTIQRLKLILPDLPLVVVSEFPPPEGEWIPYHIRRSWSENYGLVRWRLRGRAVRISAVILEPRTPYWRMRALGLALAPLRFLAFNDAGGHFMLRPRSIPTMLRHLIWRAGNFVRWHARPKSGLRTLSWAKVGRAILYGLARAKLRVPALFTGPAPWPRREFEPGISVVIPSRNGRELLAACLPRIGDADEIIVVDNGSDDGTAEYLAREFPLVLVEHSDVPLSFAAAVNRGARRARYTHLCLLNNDMLIEPGFLEALRSAFELVPDLFASTAQIFFPPGKRREETGKTSLRPALAATAFPVRCDEPLEGEDLSYVLYPSGGCTLYDARKFAELGGFDEVYAPAYVEDLDLGVRAWKRGWPSVYRGAAKVLHQHRATTSRYFTEAELERVLERNFVRFLARVVPGRGARGLWRDNATRLYRAEKTAALAFAASLPALSGSGPAGFLDLVNGDVAVFPGRAPSGKPAILVASPYLPFPLSHGGAVRIYNLMRQAAHDFDLVLVSFVEDPAPCPRELLEMCVEVVTVRRPGSHALPTTPRPDTVEEFDSPAFHAALRQSVAKWRPGIAQLEFTQMAQYARDCASPRVVLVEHDITYDLFAQMLARQDDWETRRQYTRWVKFEQQAWWMVERVVVMSERDRSLVWESVVIPPVVLPNGVDLERFRSTGRPPDARRLLFIGSLAHKPNVLALEFFLRDVFPRLEDVTLHVIAGQRHERFWDLRQAGVEVEGFVADVRPAYERATVVIAPLVASAGTNIKIMEAMAMGKAIVSTTAGIHGLEMEPGVDVIVEDSAEAMARAITRLLDDPIERAALEQRARATAERLYGWDAIGARQKQMYEGLL
ncbi:MAG TPA: glycosyltransferase [Bryobacteraceae bacterium]|nr:glycosyltransferase [Bryobacteraceae bacterium]